MYYTTKKGPSCANRIALEKSALALPFRSQCLTQNHTTFRGGIPLLYPFSLRVTRQIPLLDVVEGVFLLMEKSVSASPDRLIRVKELRQMLGNPSLSTIYRWIAKGILLEPQRLTPRFIGWRASDIVDFLNSRKNGGASND